MVPAAIALPGTLFTWIGWSAWMPFYLANERQLGFPTMATYLSVWMFFAIFAYWICGWLCDQFGRRYVIPAFAVECTTVPLTTYEMVSPVTRSSTALVDWPLASGCLTAVCGVRPLMSVTSTFMVPACSGR